MADTPIELAKPDALWCGIRPGMTREAVRAALQQRGVEIEDYAGGDATASAENLELDLEFTSDSSDYLWQIVLSADQIVWNGEDLVDTKLDEALRIMGSPATAVWESKINSDPSSPSYDAAQPPPAEEVYLENGTVWLPERGLGIILFHGEVVEFAWRDLRHLPKRYDGPVTPAQRELSKREDLSTYLEEKRGKRHAATSRKDPLRPVRILITIAAVAGIVWTIKLGFVDDIRWKQAPTVTARVVAIEKLPMKQFRDYVLPPLRWLFPPAPDRDRRSLPARIYHLR